MREWRMGKPSEAGVEAGAILRLLNSWEEARLGVHSVMILRYNICIAQGWWKPYRPEENHVMFSLSKSFTSTAIGFAVQEGLLSLEDTVLSFFPDVLPYAPCETMGRMKVRHLLTMATGHSREPWNFRDNQESDWVYAFLSSYVDREPGSQFVYNTPASYMLSAIVQKCTGMTVCEYLRPRLFDPLDIHDIWWETCPRGINTGGFGLNIKTEDIAKFGTFLLQQGAYGGKQLLNSKWIEAASAWQIANGEGPGDWSQGYGYQFWRCEPEGVFRGDGAHGQYCIVMPKQDMVIAITSGSVDMGGILTRIWEHLLPGVKSEKGLPENEVEQALLTDTLASLQLPVPEGAAQSPLHTGREAFQFENNCVGLESMAFDFAESTVCLKIKGDELTGELGYGSWKDGHSTAAPHTSSIGLRVYEKAAMAGAWIGETTYRFAVVYYTTPYVDTVTVQLDEGVALVEYSRNCGFEEGTVRILGKRWQCC